MAASRKLVVEIVGDSRSLDRALGKSERRMGQFSKKAERDSSKLSGTLKKAAGAAGAAAIGYAAIDQAKGAITTTLDLGKATRGLHKNLGLSVAKSSEWAAVAKVSNIETKALNTTFASLQQKSRLAAQGGDKQVATFKALGVTQRELKSLNFNQLLGQVADGLRNMKDPSDRTAASIELFGRGWQSVGPLLRDGSKAMNEQLALARKYGATFSGEGLKGVQNLAKAQREARFATLGLQVAFGTHLAPQLAKVIPLVSRFVQQMRTGKGAGGDFARVLGAYVRAIVDVHKWLYNAIRAVDRWGDATRRRVFAVRDAFRSVARTIAKLWGDAMAAILRAMARVFDIAAKLPIIGRRFRGIADNVRAAARTVDRLGEAVKDLPAEKHMKVVLSLAASGGGKKLQPLESFGPGGDPKAGLEQLIARGAQGWAEANKSQFMVASGAPGAGVNTGTFKKANQVASRFGLRISSSYRSPSHNARVGGVPGSLHTHGSPRNPGAIDMVGSLPSMYAALGWARSKWPLKEAMVHDAGSGLHLHLGFFKKGGMVGGSGSGDRVPAMLEPGEGIINRKAVAAMGGEGAINAMNQAVPRFQSGGVVQNIARWARRAGFREGHGLKTAIAVALAESGGNVRAHGDRSLGGSHGLWQIHKPSHPDAYRYGIRKLYDPVYNAMQAFRISGGGSNWKPWTTYNTKAYKRYTGAAAAAIRATRKGAGSKAPSRGKAPDKRSRKPIPKRKQYEGQWGYGTEGGATWRDVVETMVTRAGMTRDLQDDIVAAKLLKTVSVNEYTRAVQSGDPRKIGAALQNVQAAKEGLFTAAAAPGNLMREHQELARQFIEASPMGQAFIAASQGGGAGGGANLAEEIKGLREEMRLQRLAAERAVGTGSATAWKALADIMSGQIGNTVSQRAVSAGDGRLARF